MQPNCFWSQKFVHIHANLKLGSERLRLLFLEVAIYPLRNQSIAVMPFTQPKWNGNGSLTLASVRESVN